MEKSINIAFLIPTLHKGGAEKIAAELSKALPKEWKKYVIVFEEKVSYEYEGELVSFGIPMERGLKEIFFIPKRAKKLKEIVEKKGIDVVMSFDEIASLVNLLSNSKAGKIVAIHKSIIMADKEKGIISKAIAKIARKQYNKACKIICVSEGIKEELISYVKIDEEKVKVMYNPHDIKKIKEMGEGKIEVKLPEDYILNVGRAEKQKGQWYLLRAFKEVKKKDKNIKLIIISRGKLLEYLKDLSKKLGIENDVIILDGWIKNIYPIIKRARVVVLSSLFEGFPNVLIEALALKKAIISSDCRTGPREIIGSIKKEENYFIGERGILIGKFDGKMKGAKEPLSKEEKALSDAILRLIKDDKLRERIEEAGEKFVLKFDKKNIIKEYVKVIKECKKKK